MQITKQVSSLPSIAQLQNLLERVDAAQTPEQVIELSAMASVLQEAMRVSDASHEMQFEAAKLRISAERKLGVLLSQILQRGRYTAGQLESLRITKNRSSQAQKLARISDEQFESYCNLIRGSKRDLSMNGILKTVEKKPKPEKSNLADTYSAPPIDVQLARELLGDVSEEIITIVQNAMNEALKKLNPRYALVYAKRTGINDDGTYGQKQSFGSIGAVYGWSREYTENIYYRASTEVHQTIASHALNELRSALITLSNITQTYTQSWQRQD